MNKRKAIGLSLLLCFSISLSAAESIGAKIERLNDECRGGSGDSPKTWKACRERDALIEKRPPEHISIYSPNGRRDGDSFMISAAGLVAYPERPCHITEIPNYRRMRLATMSRSPVCYFKRDDQVIVVGPQLGVEQFPDALFAIAVVNPDGQTATILHPGFDSETAMKQNIANEQSRSRRVMPGAELPPRDVR